MFFGVLFFQISLSGAAYGPFFLMILSKLKKVTILTHFGPHFGIFPDFDPFWGVGGQKRVIFGQKRVIFAFWGPLYGCKTGENFTLPFRKFVLTTCVFAIFVLSPLENMQFSVEISLSGAAETSFFKGYFWHMGCFLSGLPILIGKIGILDQKWGEGRVADFFPVRLS